MAMYGVGPGGNGGMAAGGGAVALAATGFQSIYIALIGAAILSFGFIMLRSSTRKSKKN